MQEIPTDSVLRSTGNSRTFIQRNSYDLSFTVIDSCFGFVYTFCDIDFFKHPYFVWKMDNCHHSLDRRLLGSARRLLGGASGREKTWRVTQWTLCDPWVQLQVCGAHSDADVLPLSPGSRPSPLSLWRWSGDGTAVHQDVVPLRQRPPSLDGEENQLG